eukprot:Rhum_TRINITY_DN16627_c0_g1::Rhum_TRINITY_DN16627_c0_g1_i1::g.163962::m.163962
MPESMLPLVTLLLCTVVTEGAKSYEIVNYISTSDIGNTFSCSQGDTGGDQDIMMSAPKTTAGFKTWSLTAPNQAEQSVVVTEGIEAYAQKFDRFQASATRGCGIRYKKVYFYDMKGSQAVFKGTRLLPDSSVDVTIFGSWCYVVHHKSVTAYDMRSVDQITTTGEYPIPAGGAMRIRIALEPYPVLVVSLLANGVVFLAPETLEVKSAVVFPGCDKVYDATECHGDIMATACGEGGMKLYQFGASGTFRDPVPFWSTADKTTIVDSTSTGDYSYVVRGDKLGRVSVLDIHKPTPLSAPTIAVTFLEIKALDLAMRERFIFALTSATLFVFSQKDQVTIPVVTPIPATSAPVVAGVNECNAWKSKISCETAMKPKTRVHCEWVKLRCQNPPDTGVDARELVKDSELAVWAIVLIVVGALFVVSTAACVTLCLCRKKDDIEDLGSVGSGKRLPPPSPLHPPLPEDRARGAASAAYVQPEEP